jgi:nicotinate-nucleotide pyrophosphorylase
MTVVPASELERLLAEDARARHRPSRWPDQGRRRGTASAWAVGDDTALPEHRVFLSEADLAAAARRLRGRAPERKLVVEVGSPAEGLAAAAGFDVIQPEKLTPEAVAQLAAIGPRAPRPVIAAAGGISADHAAAFVRAGADVLVTSWPYPARPADAAVEIAAEE